jgi:transposase
MTSPGQDGKAIHCVVRTFRLAAQTVGHTDTPVGAFYRRMRSKHGAPKTIVATARKIARTIFHRLKDKRKYVDFGPPPMKTSTKSRCSRI